MNRKVFWLEVIAALVGLLTSMYLIVFDLTRSESMCLGNGGCLVVQNSRYSEVYGIPLSFIGFGGYAVILLVLAFENRYSFLQEYGKLLAFGMSLTGFLYSLYLTYLELYVIHAICPFCVISAIAMTIVFICASIRLFKENKTL
jgi:uncharacterized membrane protein